MVTSQYKVSQPMSERYGTSMYQTKVLTRPFFFFSETTRLHKAGKEWFAECETDIGRQVAHLHWWWWCYGNYDDRKSFNITANLSSSRHCLCHNHHHHCHLDPDPDHQDGNPAAPARARGRHFARIAYESQLGDRHGYVEILSLYFYSIHIILNPHQTIVQNPP